MILRAVIRCLLAACAVVLIAATVDQAPPGTATSGPGITPQPAGAADPDRKL